METLIFHTAEERNAFIEKCYRENIKYHYSDKNSEGEYKVVTFGPRED